MKESLDRTSKTIEETRTACENLGWKTTKRRGERIITISLRGMGFEYMS